MQCINCSVGTQDLKGLRRGDFIQNENLQLCGHSAPGRGAGGDGINVVTYSTNILVYLVCYIHCNNTYCL